MSKMIHGDNNTLFEYHEYEKVQIRTKLKVCNVLIEVYKPGTFPMYNRAYSKCPVVKMSMNGTGYLNLEMFDFLKQSINKAIDILNNENVGIIERQQINNFSLGNYGQKKIWGTLPKKDTLYIRQADLKVGYVYSEQSGKEWVYLGNSYLMETMDQVDYDCYNSSNNDGVTYSRYLYGSAEFIKAALSGYHTNVRDIRYGEHNSKSYKILDIVPYNVGTCFRGLSSYATKKRIVKEEYNLLHIPKDVRIVRFGDMGQTLTFPTMIIIRNNNEDMLISPRVNIGTSAGMDKLIKLAYMTE